MSTPSGTDSTSIRPLSTGEQPSSAEPDGSWLDALYSLLAARAALFQYESKAAARQWVRIAALLTVAAAAAAMAWLLLVAGGVAALSASTGWPWYWLAIAAAVLHLLAATICLGFAKTPRPATFPHTNADSQKATPCLESRPTPRNIPACWNGARPP